MRTNLEKWNYYKAIIDRRTNEFIESALKGKNIPESYYAVYPIGKIAERTITGTSYAHYKNGFTDAFCGKKPTAIDVQRAGEYSASDIFFSEDHIYFRYSETHDGFGSRSAVKFLDVVNQKDVFFTMEAAQLRADEFISVVEFKKLHKKDASYDYNANGYKFLGWQNGWQHEYYDSEGNLCTESGRPKVTFGYSKEKHPVYRNCIDSGHTRIEVQHNQRGSENSVSCPICKIYWKYDCSD